MSDKPRLPPRPGRSATLDEGFESEEAPPAYTPAADAYHGEQHVAAGPSRPFQDAPTHAPMSADYAQQGGNMDIGHGRPDVGINSSYPPQPPVHPQAHHNGSNSWSPPIASPSSSSASPSRHEAPRRRKYEPTTTPVPGQPLLHDGKLLVFPQGKSHTPCSKCGDTGYKKGDPSNPCSSCWKKHGKLFTSALRISLASSGESEEPPIGVQRPLPEKKPQPASPPQQSYASYQPHAPPPNIIPMAGPSYSPWGYSSPYGYGYGGGYPGYGYQQVPPPGAVVYQAGDPRIGGMLCQRCGGDGLVPGGLFMLSEDQCPACRGTGRVF